MKKFETANDIPDFPSCKTLEEHQKYVKEFIEAGAIPRKDLIVGAWYLGSCRNTSVAQWLGSKFRFIRDKFSGSYIDTINHFEDDNTFDLFIPFKLLAET